MKNTKICADRMQLINFSNCKNWTCWNNCVAWGTVTISIKFNRWYTL